MALQAHKVLLELPDRRAQLEQPVPQDRKELQESQVQMERTEPTEQMAL
jgi:hypothetical protein